MATPLEKIERARRTLLNALDLTDVTTQQEIVSAIIAGIDELSDAALDIAKADPMPVAPPIDLAQEVFALGVAMNRARAGQIT